jgi:hypothetical protein
MASGDPESTVHLRKMIDARDVKLNDREEILATQHLERLRICRCNMCLGENRSLRNIDVVKFHLNRYGQAPFLRGSTIVSVVDSIAN